MLRWRHWEELVIRKYNKKESIIQNNYFGEKQKIVQEINIVKVHYLAED